MINWADDPDAYPEADERGTVALLEALAKHHPERLVPAGTTWRQRPEQQVRAAVLIHQPERERPAPRPRSPRQRGLYREPGPAREHITKALLVAKADDDAHAAVLALREAEQRRRLDRDLTWRHPIYPAVLAALERETGVARTLWLIQHQQAELKLIRLVLIWVLHTAGMSSTQVGACLGLDHTTVLHHVGRLLAVAAEHPRLAQLARDALLVAEQHRVVEAA